MAFPVVYQPATKAASGPTPGAKVLMAWCLANYPPGTNLGRLALELSEPGAASTAPALANTCERGASVSDRTCSIEGCAKRPHAKGLCGAHYQRMYRHGDPLTQLRATPKPGARCSVPGCVGAHHAKGYCSLHHYRWSQHGDPEAGRTLNGVAMETMRQILSGQLGNECIEWPHSKNNAGYGQLKYQGRTTPAHRVALTLHSGPAPSPAHEAAHAPVICHNRACVNPLHLRWATTAENNADKLKDGTA